MREMAPSVSVSGVVLSDSGLERYQISEPPLFGETKAYPLSVTNVGTPSLPVLLLLVVLEESVTLCAMILWAKLLEGPLSEGTSGVIGVLGGVCLGYLDG